MVRTGLSLRLPLARFSRAAWLASAIFVARAEASDRPRGDGDHPPEAARARVFADAPALWIHGSPSKQLEPIGYVRAGQSLLLRSTRIVSRVGCPGGWLETEPLGFVCLDRNASLRPTRYVKSMRSLAPERGALPFRYALSLGNPAYRRLPERDELRVPSPRAEEGAIDVRLARLDPGHADLAAGRLRADAALPWFLEGGGSVARELEDRFVRREITLGSMVAYSNVFEHDGRTFAQASDGTIHPSDRLLAFAPSTFEGVELGDGATSLPLAFARQGAESFSLRADASCRPSRLAPESGGARDGRVDQLPLDLPARCLERHAESVTPRSIFRLTGRVVRVNGERYLVGPENRGRVPLLAEKSAHLAERRAPPETGLDRLVAFSIARGTLVLYEGQRPVFATLASPGRGGVPPFGSERAPRTTPPGLHRVQFKHWTDDMSPDWGERRRFVASEVPFAIYFAPPFALHVAYWHERFGEPMSGGCINVSPRDGERIFSFTSPALPPGFHGVAASPATGRGTAVWIERY